MYVCASTRIDESKPKATPTRGNLMVINKTVGDKWERPRKTAPTNGVQRLFYPEEIKKIKFGGEKYEVGERIGVEDRSAVEGLLTKCER